MVSSRGAAALLSISISALLLFSTLLLVPAAAYDTISGHPCFRNLKGTTDSMFDLATNYPNLATVIDIGDSYLKANDKKSDEYNLDGGYDIYAMNITASNAINRSNSPTQSADKGKVLIIAGVHPRELAPPELVMRFAEMLLEGYNKDADITWLLEQTEIHLIFHVNPDGRYVAENYKSVFWRKNLNDEEGDCSSVRFGVDLNRNYDFMWGDQNGASDNPCSSTYHGPSPHSEPETQAVVTYARNLFPAEQRRDNDPEGKRNVPFGEDIQGVFVDVHAPGGYVFYPWGFEDDKSPDDEAFQALGRKMSYFNGYKLWAGGQPDFLYPAAGDSSDYMYAVLGVASFGLELGEDFYEDCDLFEDEVVPDNLSALLYAAATAKKPFSLVKGPDILDLDINISSDANDGSIRVTAVASDSLLVNTIRGFGDHVTGDQGVSKVQLYLDVHPDNFEQGDITWDMQFVLDNSEEYTFEKEMIIPTSGDHTLYAQAVDSKGYVGPVSSAFFLVEKVETAAPSPGPTLSPSSSAPTRAPTAKPTHKPSKAPTDQPTPNPSKPPTDQPTSNPSKAPTDQPTPNPSKPPTDQPIPNPSKAPTDQPTPNPSKTPSAKPTANPSTRPSRSPIGSPSRTPSNVPVTVEPSASPTGSPTTETTSMPPTATPSMSPTEKPSNSPSMSPLPLPTMSPTSSPSSKPTSAPSIDLSNAPSDQPSASPSNVPSTSNPTLHPANSSSPQPTKATAPQPGPVPTVISQMDESMAIMTPSIQLPLLSDTPSASVIPENTQSNVISNPPLSSSHTSSVALSAVFASLFLTMYLR